MIIFKIIFIAILLLNIGIGMAVKYNYKGLQDRIVSFVIQSDIEDFVRNQFPNRWICQTLFLLIIFLLCI